MRRHRKHDRDRDTGRRRKEKVIHTRVSEDLEDELKQRAADLGVSVSNLVRNVLANTIEMVEGITRDASQVADATHKSAQRLASIIPGASRFQMGHVSVAPYADDPEPERLGWQELVLSKNAVCEDCNEILPKGTAAAVAVYDRPGPPAFLCKACLIRLKSTPDKDDDHAGDPAKK